MGRYYFAQRIQTSTYKINKLGDLIQHMVIAAYNTVSRGFPGGSIVKNLPANTGDTDLIPGLGRSPGERYGNPLQYSCLGKPKDRGAQRTTIHGLQESLTQLSD